MLYVCVCFIEFSPDPHICEGLIFYENAEKMSISILLHNFVYKIAGENMFMLMDSLCICKVYGTSNFLESTWEDKFLSSE